MYEQYYGFKRLPFIGVPDPGTLYRSPTHQKAYSILKYAVMVRAGFCVVTGEAGTGKTTLVRALLQEIGGQLDVGVVTNSQFDTFEELLRWILLAFDLEYESTDKVTLYDTFARYLIKKYKAKQPVTLIIDEAQNLGPQQLEQLRMLSNINTEKGIVLQTILVGQPELWSTLKRPDLRQFAQRISYDVELKPLDSDHLLADYVRFRLKQAGGSEELFEPETYPFIWLATEGLPRLINLVCETCLIYGYAEQQPRIGLEIVDRVINDKADSLAPIIRPSEFQANKANVAEQPESADSPKGPKETARSKIESSFRRAAKSYSKLS